MGKRGRQPTSTAVLSARGSWRAQDRKKKASEVRRRPAPRTVAPRAKIISQAQIFSLIPGYDPRDQAGECRFEMRAARKAIDFFHKRLTHVKGQTGPFILEPWQQAIIGNMFGWKHKDGTRRYREAFIYIPKKNGKTFLASGLALYVLTEDGERGAECYGIASSKDQASLSFKYAAGMVQADPKLSEALDVFGISGGSQQRSLVRKDDQLAFYRPLPADADTADGSNVHFFIADEIHRYPNGDLLDIMNKSTAARRQPLSVYITTADYDRPSACNNLLRRAKEVRDNKGDPNQPGFNSEFLPVIYEALRSEDWKSPTVWAKANPNLGVSLQQSFLEAECKKAVENPSEENSFKRFHLNILTEQAERWLQLDLWDACAGELDLEALRGAECWAGLDLSSTTDITALVLFFPSVGNSILPFFWIPQEGAELRSKRDRVPYPVWARGGLLEMTPGNVIDYAYIRAKVNSLTKIYNIREIAYDPWNATQIALELKEQDGLPMVEFRQGYLSMNEPCKELERLMTAGRLRHGGNPILRWMAGNVSKASDPAGNIKIDKAKSVEKVDGMVATVMALGRSMLKGGTQSGSVYEGRGLEVMG